MSIWFSSDSQQSLHIESTTLKNQNQSTSACIRDLTPSLSRFPSSKSSSYPTKSSTWDNADPRCTSKSPYTTPVLTRTAIPMDTPTHLITIQVTPNITGKNREDSRRRNAAERTGLSLQRRAQLKKTEREAWEGSANTLCLS